MDPSCSLYLEVVLPVYMQSVAEHVPHHQQVGVLALNRDSVHGQELREQRVAVAGDYMLEENGREQAMNDGTFNEKPQPSDVVLCSPCCQTKRME